MKVIAGKGVNRCADCSMDDDLEERESGADSVCLEGQGWRRREKRVHDVIGVGGESNHKQKLRSLLDRTDDSLDRRRFREPGCNRFTEECPAESVNTDGSSQCSKIGDNGPRPCPVSVTRERDEGGVQWQWCCDMMSEKSG